MGNGFAGGHFAAPSKAKLGWIPPERVATAVGLHSVYWVADVEQPGASAVRVPVPGDATGEQWYWLTARQIGTKRSSAVVSRSYPQAAPLATVAVWSVLSSVALSDTLAYDATPETLTDTAALDAMLHEGRSWSDPETRSVHFTLLSCNASGVEVHVSVGRFLANRPPVIHSVRAVAEDAADPLTVTLTVNASDDDGDELSVFWSHRNAARFGQTYSTAARFAAGRGPTGRLTHSYSSSYQRRALVWVSDRRGGVAQSFVDFFGYENVAPTLSSISAAPVNNQPQGWFTLSSDASDFDLITYRWNFGDGHESSASTPHHAFAAGTHTVSLTVSDGENSTTVSSTISV